jgi:uncharacterized protein DUF4279
MYDDDYASCSGTYVTIRIYPGELLPDEITQRLGIEPSRTQVRGSGTPTAQAPVVPRLHGWFLSSEGAVRSLDCRRHIDWLLRTLGPVHERLQVLRRSGVRMDISCYWGSAWNHGGPTLSPAQLEGLARVGLDFWFDVYPASEVNGRGDR